MIIHPENAEFYHWVDQKFREPRNRAYPMMEAWSLGTKAINDVSTDLDTHNWFGWTEEGWFKIKREDLPEEHSIAALPRGKVTQLDFCFDQTARPVAVFVIDGEPHLYYYKDNDFAFEKLHASIKCPRLVLDNYSLSDIGTSDVILGYCHDGKLCYRMQRERYAVEYVIGTDPNKHLLWRIGHMMDGRIGFQWR